MKKHGILKGISILCLSLTLVIMIFCPSSISAEDGVFEITGKVFTFDKDNSYVYSESDNFLTSDKTETYGSFFVSGNVNNISTIEDIPCYTVESGNLEFYYTYSDSMLTADENEWHLIADNGKNVNGKILNDKIMNGAIILQSSKDRQTWIDEKYITNVFSDTPVQTEAFATSKDVQLLNGCYYRLIVVYETRIKTDPKKLLFLTIDNYEYKKSAEIYEFYACSVDKKESEIPEQTHSLGSRIRTKKFDGYSGETEITKKDSHYNWDLGHFFVSGYTETATNSNNDIVFLKNLDDKVTLWFNLEQNIDAINGDKNLSISADSEGYDEYFETDRMNFGRGTLIIRYTDHNGNKTEPQIYTNYLEANATVVADTIVQLFEEGDYEIALDYEVTDNKLIDTIAHYRIFFKFSVRNGNCMVFPFDVVTGNELTNSSMTENGFRIDKAKSRYLKVNVKREVLTESAEGLVEDTRFNGPAKDGEEYTEEGIYTLTVHNEYTNQFTTKKIYVGTNKVLKAFMTTGLSIPEINNLVATGATIANDGTITLSSMPAPEQTEQQDKSEKTESKSAETNNNKITILYIFAAVIILLGAVSTITIIAIKKKKN